MFSIIKQEPVLTMGVIQSALALVVSFGLHLSAEQMGAILTASAAVLSLVVRRKVSPRA